MSKRSQAYSVEYLVKQIKIGFESDQKLTRDLCDRQQKQIYTINCRSVSLINLKCFVPQWFSTVKDYETGLSEGLFGAADFEMAETSPLKNTIISVLRSKPAFPLSIMVTL